MHRRYLQIIIIISRSHWRKKKENKGILLKCFELMVWTIYQNVWFNSKWRCLRSPHYHLELRSNCRQNPKTMISFPPIEGTDLSQIYFFIFFVQGQRSKRVSTFLLRFLLGLKICFDRLSSFMLTELKIGQFRFSHKYYELLWIFSVSIMSITAAEQVSSFHQGDRVINGWDNTCSIFGNWDDSSQVLTGFTWSSFLGTVVASRFSAHSLPKVRGESV